jgi:hypothetical protein
VGKNKIMAKKKTDSERRKKFRNCRIREKNAEAAQRIADLLSTDFSEVVNQAVRKYAIELGVWDAPKEKD